MFALEEQGLKYSLNIDLFNFLVFVVFLGSAVYNSHIAENSSSFLDIVLILTQFQEFEFGMRQHILLH